MLYAPFLHVPILWRHHLTGMNSHQLTKENVTPKKLTEISLGSLRESELEEGLLEHDSLQLTDMAKDAHGDTKEDT